MAREKRIHRGEDPVAIAMLWAFHAGGNAERYLQPVLTQRGTIFVSHARMDPSRLTSGSALRHGVAVIARRWNDSSSAQIVEGEFRPSGTHASGATPSCVPSAVAPWRNPQEVEPVDQPVLARLLRAGRFDERPSRTEARSNDRDAAGYHGRSLFETEIPGGA